MGRRAACSKAEAERPAERAPLSLLRACALTRDRLPDPRPTWISTSPSPRNTSVPKRRINGRGDGAMSPGWEKMVGKNGNAEFVDQPSLTRIPRPHRGHTSTAI
jgi:hypothetical protein